MGVEPVFPPRNGWSYGVITWQLEKKQIGKTIKNPTLAFPPFLTLNIWTIWIHSNLIYETEYKKQDLKDWEWENWEKYLKNKEQIWFNFKHN